MAILKYCSRIVFISLILWTSTIATARALPLLVYSLDVDGKQVGHIALDFKKQPDGGHKIKLSTRIEFSSFWANVDILSTVEESISANGLLQTASNKLTENKKTYWTKIEHSEGEYLAFRARMKNSQEIEDAELVGLAKDVVAALVPGAGDVITVAEIVFSDERDSPKHKRLTPESFDTSLAGLPLYWQRNGYTFPDSLRIINIEDMTIFKATIEDLGAVTIPTLSGNAETRHYRLTVDQGSPIEIWLTKPDGRTPYFVQLNGKEGGRTFKVRLNQGPPK